MREKVSYTILCVIRQISYTVPAHLLMTCWSSSNTGFGSITTLSPGASPLLIYSRKTFILNLL